MRTFGYTTDDITTALDGVTPVPGVTIYVWPVQSGLSPLLTVQSGLDGSYGWSEDTTVNGRWVSTSLDGDRWWVPANEAVTALSDRVDTTETRISGVEDELPLKLDVAAANSTYARVGQVPTFGAFGPLKRALSAGRTTAIQVVGDSTGNETWEWARLWLSDLMAAHPEYTVRALTWDDTKQDFTRETLQTGTAGAEYLNCDGTAVRLGAPSTHISGTIDVRVKAQAANWTALGGTKMLAGQMGGAGARSWALQVTAGGVPSIMYSTDGSAVATQNAPAAVTAADGSDLWVRAVVTPDDGAGNRVFKFYQSTDGATWTQLGATITLAGALTLFNAASADPLYGFGLGGELIGSTGRWVGRIYEVQVRNGLDGPLVAPAMPSLWTRTQVSSASVAGAPTLTLVNASHPGAAIAYLGDTTRVPKLTPDYGQAVTLLSDSHNEAHRVGSYFTGIYQGWIDTLKQRLVGVPFVILTQNPENPAASWAPEQAKRRSALLAYAAANKIGAVDTFQPFLDYAGPLTDLLADQVHPNATGQGLWKQAVADQFAAA